ncbi:hypothetical protein NBT05_03370 [Aquimarina sp. ERC-38]|uniref:hypothetical protein n=1 Tax=Aquimarina sp. ERC-38 TaxID=2949996 RepID=UPI0022452D31|nr:hypothetical protein [Aquimarina sp. ERC-38]UZO81521.1 hypothetical protein NBT05_03370 [Aquimarina sp. ERC-38]
MSDPNISSYTLTYEAHYAILVMEKDAILSVEVANKITKQLKEYYKEKNFILITHRKYPHEIDLNVYKGKILKNMIGFAIVSNNPEELKRALQEQPLWNEAFTFFKELDQAKSWALSFF